MKVNGNKPQEDTIIGANKVHLNPCTGKPQSFRMKKCKRCGEEFQVIAPSHLYCSTGCADEAHNDHYLRRVYNISLHEWMCMFEESGGRCYICNGRGVKLNKHAITSLVTDHCHETGRVRGLLCANCNRALGLFKDNKDSLKSAIDYLETPTTIREEYTQVSGSGGHLDGDDIV